MSARVTLCTAVGLLSSVFVSLFGEWDGALVTLVIFMTIDYISGVVCAGVFHKSEKSDGGSLESAIGWRGLAKKAMTLLFILIGHRLDLALGSAYIRDALVWGFMANELISITENAGLMGVPLPTPIQKAIDILAKKGGDDT